MNAFYHSVHLLSNAKIVDHDSASFTIQKVQTSDSNCNDFNGGATIQLSFRMKLCRCDKCHSLEWFQQQQQQFQMADKHLIEMYLQFY